MRKKKPMNGRLGLWECGACGRRAECQPRLVDGWLNYRGSRLCQSCFERFNEMPVGTYVDLGNGCRLVKVSQRRGTDPSRPVQ